MGRNALQASVKDFGGREQFFNVEIFQEWSKQSVDWDL